MSEFGKITTDIEDFLDLVSEQVPTCPEFLKLRALRRSLDDFFRRTRSWREIVEEHRVFAGDKWVYVNSLARHVSSHAIPLSVDDVVLSDDKTRLSMLDIQEMDMRQTGWIGDTAESPTGFILYEDRRLRIYPAMASDADAVDLDFELVLTCDTDITTVPDYVFDHHREAVVNGAVLRLLTQPEKPWTDPGRASMFAAIAQSEITSGNAERAKRAVDAVNRRSHARHFGA